MTQPFLPLFFGDFLASTAEWSGEERALYLLALSYQWSMGSLPADHKRLSKLVDFERRSFDASWKMVSKKFVERDGRLYNLRLEQHREKSKELGKKRALAGANGAAKRWQTNGNSHEALNGNEIANAKELLSHPSHPIPSNNQSKSELRSPDAIRGSRIPEDFSLTDERREVATAEGLDPTRTFASFRDFWVSKPGAGGRKLDWDATWRNWCRNDKTPRKQKSGGPNGIQVFRG